MKARLPRRTGRKRGLRATSGISQPVRSLTPREQRFIEEYLVDLNASAAARRAGYSQKNADVVGPRLLGRVGIAQAIQEATAERSRRTQITQDRVLRELAAVGLANLTDFASWDATGNVTYKASDAIDPSKPGALVELRVSERTEGDAVARTLTLRLHPGKIAALEDLARHIGLNIDRNLRVQAELTGKDGQPLLPVAVLQAIIAEADRAATG